MSEFGLAQAQTLVERALDVARTRFEKPICVSILDQAGFLLAFARQDGAPLRSIQISEGKAYTAARIGITTEAFFERCKKDEVQPIDFCDPKLTKLPGGAPLKTSAGKLVGAAGVSGLTAAQDQEIVDLLAAEVAKL
jgi:uncharacterized protein GlcG (DUF336 family)